MEGNPKCINCQAAPYCLDPQIPPESCKATRKWINKMLGRKFRLARWMKKHAMEIIAVLLVIISFTATYLKHKAFQ